MINLAGHKDPDPIAEEELFVVGIEVERVPPYGETKTSVAGRLGQIAFRRAWHYWVAEGPVPLAIAQRMYEQQPYGRRDVRVAGHCGCPPPEDPWLTYRDKDGRQIYHLCMSHDQALYAQFLDGTISERMGDVLGPLFRGELGPVVTTRAERKALATSITVDSYHIDSQGGLKVFADAMRPHD